MDLLKEYKPELHDGLQQIAACWDDETLRQNALNEIWFGLEKIAIDNAVAEPAAMEGKVAVIPATFGAFSFYDLMIVFSDVYMYRLGRRRRFLFACGLASCGGKPTSYSWRR
jgi:hypothetical protein